MSANVIPLASATSQLQAARLRHPAGNAYTVDTLMLLEDPARALTQVARSWEQLHRCLATGPGALTEADADAALQTLLNALVHRHARAALVLTWPQVRFAVRQLDQVLNGDLEPLDIGCLTTDQAIAHAHGALDWHLYPLIHGLPARDACPVCVRVCSSVNAWQTRRGCTSHRRSL